MQKQFCVEGGIWNIICPYAKNMLCDLITILVMIQFKSFLGLENDLASIMVFGCITIVIYAVLQKMIYKGLIEAFQSM